MQTTIPFRVHPRAIKELGDRLVTDDLVAISELVKNAYDASASEVTVRFGTDNTGQYLEIEDDGHGMSLEIIRDVWTVLFTPYKKVMSAKKRSGRAFSGEKGIGRLSAARLGKELEVYTQEAGEKCYHLLLEWDDFEKLDSPKNYTDLSYDNFGVIVEECAESPFKKNKAGTIIRISSLKRDDWLSNSDLLKELRSELARIRPPLRKYEGFTIFLSHPLVDNSPVNISGEYPKFLDKPHYYFTGKVSSDGALVAKLSISKPNYVKEIEYDETVDSEIELDDFINLCGPFDFEFRVWDLDSDSIENLSDKINLTKTEIRNNIRANKGISLYRDQILVLPKTAGSDWLKLENRRVKRVGDKISSANIIGFVDITQKANPNIRDKADREGLQKSPESDQLEDLIIKIIERLEFERKIAKSKKEDSFSFQRLLHNEKIEIAIKTLKSSLENGVAHEEILEEVKTLEGEMENQKETIAGRLGYYSRLASVGTIASYMVHEVRNSSMSIHEFNHSGRIALEECELTNKETLKKRLDLSDVALRSLEGLSDAILPLAGSTFKRKRGQIVSLKNMIEKVETANHKILDYGKVSVTVIGDDVMVAVAEGELFILFQNLFQNAVYWLGTIKKNEKKINIEVKKAKDGYVEVYFDDNGPGIDEDNLLAIFDPGTSSKPDGTGMGLTVVAEICEKYTGNISAGYSSKLGGASFRMTFPVE